MMFSHGNKIVTKTELGTRDCSIAATDLTMLFVGGLCKTVGLCTRKTVGCFKWYLIGHSSRNMEDSAENDLNCGGPA